MKNKVKDRFNPDNYQGLVDLITTLSVLLQKGFSTPTSPLIPELDALIDINLGLADRFRPRQAMKYRRWIEIEPPVTAHHEKNKIFMGDTYEKDIWEYETFPHPIGLEDIISSKEKKWITKVPDSDDLGNIRTITMSVPKQVIQPDPRLVKYFLKQAEDAVKLKKIFEGKDIRSKLKNFFTPADKQKQNSVSGYQRRHS